MPAKASQVVNAVCVDVEDLGMRDTAYGRKHQYKVVFETDTETPYGDPLRVSRIYNKSTHKDSAFRRDMENWEGHELTDEDMANITFKSLLNEQFQIELVPVTKDGKTYQNVSSLKPATTRVTPSGLYRRKE